MPAKDILEVHLNVLLDVLMANKSSIPVLVERLMVLCTWRDSMVNIAGPEQVNKDRLHMVPTVQATSKPTVQEIERPNTPNINEN